MLGYVYIYILSLSYLKTEPLCVVRVIGAKCVRIPRVHACVLDVLFAVEVRRKDLEGLVINVLVVMVLEVIYFLHALRLFDVRNIEIYSISVASVLLSDLQYLPLIK